MATNSKASDDTTAPPSYNTISANPIQCSQSSIFPFRRMKQKRAAVLSRIRDIVLAPDFTPSSVTQNVNACAVALPTSELSNIITQLNIEGHTALYWAIVNDRSQAFWALRKLTSCYPFDCSSDLRMACMITNNHTLFRQLGLGDYNEHRRLRSLLGCPRDTILVHRCDEHTNQFNVVLQIRMFQKRTRVATKDDCYYQFVAGGRIWFLRFILVNSTGLWSAEIGLCQHSPPARLNAVLLIEAHSRKPGCATPLEALKIPLSLADTEFMALAHWRYVESVPTS
ncbi:hypothetical protein BD769DRAFT_673382 [Suillus cothurnatus]|nr:hypothetical protein BD769DRAFT_673382 [Suillus cothurnatus]